MNRLIACVFSSLVALAPILTTAADPKPGTLTIAGKSYTLAHVTAYETKSDDETRIVVLASDRPIAMDKIKASLKENGGSDEDLFLTQPHVKVRFDKAGKIEGANARSANTSLSTFGSKAEGELARDGDRVSGKAKLPTQGEGNFQWSFEFEFAAGLLGTSAEESPKAAPLAKLGVTGTFKGNGKDAKLAFVSAVKGEEFADKPSLVLIFSEKDHTKDANLKFNVGFGRYGSALIISCHEDGDIFGCEVSHSAHQKRGFSSLGKIEMVGFQIAGGQAQGKISTGGETDTFDEKWEVDLTFAAKYVAQAKPTEPKPAVTSTRPAARPSANEPKKPAPATTDNPAASLKVKELALPKSATDVVYKDLVEQMEFKSAADIKTLVAEFTKSLAGQGWTTEGSDLVTPASAILKRKRGEAELTIFVKPADGGSSVRMMTEGLDWAK